MPRSRRCAAALLAVLLAGCASSPGKPAAPPDPVPETQAEADRRQLSPFQSCHRKPKDEVAVIDETRRRVQETVCGAALWFDSLFGEGDVRVARRTNGRIEVFAAHSDFEGWDKRVRFNAHVRVPSLENRLSAFVGRDNEQAFIRDRSEGFGLRSQFPRLAEQDEWMAGLGYSLPEAKRVHIDVRAGAHGLSHPSLFVQGRVGYTAYSDDTNLAHLRGTPFVNTNDGLGFTMSVDLDHTIGATRLLRWGTVGTVTQKNDGLDWRSAVILYQNLRRKRAMGYEIFIRGLTVAAEPIGEYGGRILYRQPILRERLWLEPILGYSWPRNDPSLPREGSLAISLAVEMPFGEGY